MAIIKYLDNVVYEAEINKYLNSVVYVIRTTNNDTNKVSLYVGSTTSFDNRKKDHKSAIYNETGVEYNCKKYATIRENGNWTIEVHKKISCETKRELDFEEERIREELNADLNTISCYRTNAENVERRKVYNTKNKVKIAENAKVYNTKNKVKIAEKKKKYNADNKDELAEKRRNKITHCVCGGIIRGYEHKRHENSRRHTKYIASCAEDYNKPAETGRNKINHCVCGSIIQGYECGLKIHENTTKHKKYIASLNS